MKYAGLKILFVFVLIAMATGPGLADVQVMASVDTSKPVYVGEPFSYHIIIDGDNIPGQVDLSPLSAYNPQNAGARDVSQSSTIIVNNRRTETVTKRYIMSYQLTALRPGDIKLPSLSVSVGGNIYTTNTIDVVVR